MRKKIPLLTTYFKSGNVINNTYIIANVLYVTGIIYECI